MLCMVDSTQSTRRSQLLRGVLDLCLLATIDDDPTYGYEMTKRLAERGLSIVAEGSIYPVLGRLERERLIESFLQNGGAGPARKYYRVTATGKEALAGWTEEWRGLRTAVDSVLVLAEGEVRE